MSAGSRLECGAADGGPAADSPGPLRLSWAERVEILNRELVDEMRAIDLLDLGGGRRTPMVRQSEAAECGLACLAMVASHHGFHVDLTMLRRRFGHSLKGATLRSLIQVAEKIGFAGRPLRAEVHDLAKIGLPAVLHFDLNHFVVLTKIKRGLSGQRYRIHDPALGAQWIDADEMSRRFTGIVLELIKTQAFAPAAHKVPLRIGQLWSRMTGLWPSLGQVIILSIVLQIIALGAPFYMQLAVDSAIPAFDVDLLKMLAIGFGGLALISFVTSWLRSLILVSFGNALSYQMVVNLCRHLLQLPLPWFEKRHVGDIISRFNSTQPISNLLSQGLVAALIDGVMALLTLALMIVYSPLLAAVAVIAWGLFAALKFGFIQTMRVRSVDVIRTAAKESTSFIESIRGVGAIKAFGQEGNRLRMWQQQKADAINAQVKLGRMTSGFDAGGQFIIAAERVLFIYLAIKMAMDGTFTVGMIFAFMAYKQHFLDASTRLVDQAISYRLLDVHLNRIADIALARTEEPEGGSSPSRRSVSGALELRTAGFRYGMGEAEVLRAVDLKIEAGEMVALVGPSGGGKTTLLKLMAGLFEPSYGQVLVDGVPLKDFGLDNWRRQIGFVSQEDTLYAGTIAENIAFFDPEIDMDRVREVAAMAAVHDELEALPMRYETLIGDMGSALSGGQKQRVLLARALYSNPAILFIDEGTAHLDQASERRVMDALNALPMMRIISAHRPVPVEGATKLFLVNTTVTPLKRNDAAPAPTAAVEEALKEKFAMPSAVAAGSAERNA